MVSFTLGRSAVLAFVLAAGALAVEPACAQSADGASAGTRWAQSSARGVGSWQGPAHRSAIRSDIAARRDAFVARARGQQAPRSEAAAQSGPPERDERRQRAGEAARNGLGRNDAVSVGRATPGWRGAQAGMTDRGAAGQPASRRPDRSEAITRWPNRTIWDRGFTARSTALDDGSRDWRDGRRWDGERHRDDHWDSGWRRDRRYDWHSYRSQNRDVFRIGHYYSPFRSYYYRPLSIGYVFDNPLFYGQRYWLTNPWLYRLPSVHGPYRWVRYYDDVLLVDINRGHVDDVVYNFFW